MMFSELVLVVVFYFQIKLHSASKLVSAVGQNLFPLSAGYSIASMDKGHCMCAAHCVNRHDLDKGPRRCIVDARVHASVCI